MYFTDYFTALLDIKKWLEDWKEKIVTSYQKNFDSATQMSNAPILLASYQTVSGYAFIFFKQQVDDIIALSGHLDVIIDPILIIPLFLSQSDLERGLEGIQNRFASIEKYLTAKQVELTSQIQKLSDYERTRLNEAFYNSERQCYFSSIINAVVSLEERLMQLLKKTNEPFLKKTQKNLRFSYGELVDLYLNNKEIFSSIIPSKYDALLKFCNKYRIFSAHAKEDIMTKKDAEAILNLTFAFLLDERCLVTDN